MNMEGNADTVVRRADVYREATEAASAECREVQAEIASLETRVVSLRAREASLNALVQAMSALLPAPVESSVRYMPVVAMSGSLSGLHRGSPGSRET